MASVTQTVGIEGYPISVQVKVLAGPSVMNIVGLGDQAVKEAKDRIESAFDQLDFIFPKKKIIVNLSPSLEREKNPSFILIVVVTIVGQAGLNVWKKLS